MNRHRPLAGYVILCLGLDTVNLLGTIGLDIDCGLRYTHLAGVRQCELLRSHHSRVLRNLIGELRQNLLAAAVVLLD